MPTFFGRKHVNKTEEEEDQTKGCASGFGYLSQKEASEPIPQECIECKNVVECMLNSFYTSPTAVAEVKKWYR